MRTFATADPGISLHSAQDCRIKSGNDGFSGRPRPMNPGRGSPLLLLPAGAVFLGLFFLPMAGLFIESFRLYVPGRIGSAADAPFTLANYAELLTPSFVGFFFET